MTLDTRAYSNELFKGLTPEEVDTVARACFGVIYTNGQTLFREGEDAVRLYLVVDGGVQLYKRLPAHGNRPERDTLVATCAPGELVGWSALVHPNVYTLTAEVRRPSAYIEVAVPALLEILEAAPALRAKIMTTVAEIIARRLHLMTEALIKERLLVIQEAKRQPDAR